MGELPDCLGWEMCRVSVVPQKILLLIRDVGDVAEELTAPGAASWRGSPCEEFAQGVDGGGELRGRGTTRIVIR